MASASTRLFAIFLALLLAACGGQVRWSKAGADESALSGDMAACNAEARGAAQRMYGPPQMSSMTGPSPFGGRSAADPSPADRQMQEQEMVNHCMRGRGYVLVRVEK